MRSALVGYTAFFLVIVVAFLVAGIPAELALRQAPVPESLEPSDTRGTVWAGSSRLSDSNGSLGTVHWSLKPLPLLLGRVVGDIRLSGVLGDVSGRVALRDDRLHLSDVDLSLDMHAITSRSPSMLPIRGQLAGSIERASLGTAGINALDGRLSLRQAGTTFPVALALGDFSADISTRDQTITAIITSSEHPLFVSGEISLRDGDRYEATLLLRADDAADPALKDGLGLVGRPQADGSVRLTRRGSLQQWWTR